MLNETVPGHDRVLSTQVDIILLYGIGKASADMTQRYFLLFLLALLFTITHAATPSATPKPCTIHSPLTGSFYDLRPLQVAPSPEATSPSDPDSPLKTAESWHARGYDYPANFTLNFCGPVVEDLADVSGISETRYQNVSAFYRDAAGDIFSIGQENHLPIFRGKKLVLNYTNGSPCPELDEDGFPVPGYNLRRRQLTDSDSEEEDSDEDSSPHSSKSPQTRYKNTLLSLHCDTSPLLTTHPSIAFLGTPDHCTYVFEIRSRYACAGATPSGDSGSLGPGSVFGVILGIAFLVYLIGGCVYQRSVMHQRGWRQLPNYAVWAGLVGFVSVCTKSIFFCLRNRDRSRQTRGVRDGITRGSRKTRDQWNIPGDEEEWVE